MKIYIIIFLAVAVALLPDFVFELIFTSLSSFGDSLLTLCGYVFNFFMSLDFSSFLGSLG